MNKSYIFLELPACRRRARYKLHVTRNKLPTMTKADTITKSQLRTDLPEIKPGYTVRVYQKVKEGGKERIQPFEGLVIAKKHGQSINATFTVRKISEGIGVERIFPLHSPTIEKIEVLKKSKVRRAKLYYMRKRFGKAARLKKEVIEVPGAGEEPKEVKVDKIETKQPDETKNQTGE